MKCSIQIACALSPSIPKKTSIQEMIKFLSQEFDLSQETLTIRIVDEKESRELNKSFRGKDKPTNVLSFPGQRADFILPARMAKHLGDLVLCHTVITEEASKQGKPIENHYTHLIIHGVLHLLGYDHEQEKDALEMETLEISLLKRFNIPNPYEEINHGT